MPRPCTVCTHRERLSIDQALVAGRSTYDLAAAYGLSPDALSRHFAAHVPEHLKKARQDGDTQQALDIVKQLKAINMATLTVLNDARLAGQPDLVLRAADRVQRQLELQAKLLGELDDRPRLNVILTPEWLTARAALLAALQPYPDARVAVAERLLSLEAASGAPNGHR
jgi:DNA-binding transcriptional ArsR family regulator